VHARRGIVPVVLVVGWVLVQCGRPSGGARVRLEEPRPAVAHAGDPEHAVDAIAAPASLTELRARIEELLAREHVAGAAVALVGRDGPIWVGGVGVRDRATRAPMAADTAFRVGSLSKSIIALGVMRLADAGRLDVDRPLRELLPDIAIDNPWESVAPVTLAQCLEHTAGLDDMRFNEIFTADEDLPVRAALALNPRSREVRWRPGTRHAYSNIGYSLAALAIEVASGEPFDVYLRREILAPLGIADAAFRRTDALAPRLATGHLDDELAAPYFPLAHRASGGLLASADDLGKLVHFWIARGEGYPPIVSPAGLARIERNGTLPYPRLESDYGFASYGDVTTPVHGRGHDGGMPGFHASFRYYPELGVGYAMLLNSNYTFRGYRDLRALLYAYLTRGAPSPPLPAVGHAEPPGADYFALASPRNAVFDFIEQAQTGWRVTRTPDGVRLTELGGWVWELVPTADGAYRLADEYGSAIRFTRTADGTPVMVSGFFYAEAASGWLAWLRYTALSLAMSMLQIAPLWAAVVLAAGAIRRRRVLPHGLVLWPAIAGLACPALPLFLQLAFLRGVIGVVHPLTIAICAITILFAIASTGSLVAAVRWSIRPDRPRLAARLVPTVFALAFAGLTIWLAAHGVIGFRTWAW
jgi:CubicO group peptidase (beta-lactamase class C family)